MRHKIGYTEIELSAQGRAFADACYSDNTAEEMIEALIAPRADREDCKAWGITPTEWRHAIALALSEKCDDMMKEDG